MIEIKTPVFPESIADGEVANIAKRNNVGLTSPAENSFKLKKNIFKLYLSSHS